MSEIKLQSEYDDLDKYSYYEDIYYYKKNTKILHNPYGPAFISKDGGEMYLIDNNFHRLDGPAVKFVSGVEQYYINDELLDKKTFQTKVLKLLNKEYLQCLG